MDIAHEHMLQTVLYDSARLENGTQVGRMMGRVEVERRTFAEYIDKGTGPHARIEDKLEYDRFGQQTYFRSNT